MFYEFFTQELFHLFYLLLPLHNFFLIVLTFIYSFHLKVLFQFHDSFLCIILQQRITQDIILCLFTILYHLYALLPKQFFRVQAKIRRKIDMDQIRNVFLVYYYLFLDIFLLILVIKYKKLIPLIFLKL